MSELDAYPESNPFRLYYEGLDNVVQKTKLNVENPRDAFGFIGTLEENALKVRPHSHTFNSQGIILRQTRIAGSKKTEKLQKTLIEQHNDIKNRIKPVMDFLTSTTRTCTICLEKYQLHRNYGYWYCRYHPRSGTDVNVHECCGRQRYGAQSNGCTPCDHQSQPMDRYSQWSVKTATVEMPLTAAVQLNIQKEAYTVETSPIEMSRTKAIVRRTRDVFH